MRFSDKKRGFKQNSGSEGNNIGFYIALAICILTVAVAAWNVYGGLTTGPDEDLEAGQDISGEKYISDERTKDQNDNSDDMTDSSIYEGNSSISAEEKRASDTSAATSASDNNAVGAVVGVSSSKEKKDDENAASSKTDEQISDRERDAKDTAAEMNESAPIENGKIVKIFSPKAPVYSKTMSDWRTHRGVDIAAAEGTPVRAISDGIVKTISKDPMFGNMICIDHTDYTACYYGLTDSPVVSEGNHVSSGDTIGYIGIVPCEMLDESHLHIEVRRGENFIDPTTIF